MQKIAAAATMILVAVILLSVATPTKADDYGGIVCLSPITPFSRDVEQGQIGVAFTVIDLVAGGEDFTISRITISRNGGSDGDLGIITIWSGSTFIGKQKLKDGKATFGFLIDLRVAAYTAETLMIKADISSNAMPGHSISLGIAVPEDIDASGAISGDFPVMGNAMTITGTYRIFLPLAIK